MILKKTNLDRMSRRNLKILPYNLKLLPYMCRPGICFRLYSQRQWGCLLEHQIPEMLRSPLESLCLQVKSVLGASCTVASILARALSPPPEESVTGAMNLLKQRQALDAHEALTPLGHHLVKMPLDPAVGALPRYLGEVFRRGI